MNRRDFLVATGVGAAMIVPTTGKALSPIPPELKAKLEAAGHKNTQCMCGNPECHIPEQMVRSFELQKPYAWVVKQELYNGEVVSHLVEEGRIYNGLGKTGLSAREYAEEICRLGDTRTLDIFPVYRQENKR
jgi:hypothetical protein